MKRLLAPAPIKLKDEAAERVRRVTDLRIRELQAIPVVMGRLVADIALPDGVTVEVAHGLGRRARILLSPPRATASATTGRIRDVTSIVAPDVSAYFALKAEDWGETIYIDAWCF